VRSGIRGLNTQHFMKTPKLIVAFVAILLFSNLAFAGNPKKDFTENLANNILSTLSADITNLTDSQKLVIQTIAQEYETKLRNGYNNRSSKFDSVFIKNTYKPASIDYQTKLNNILTAEQKEVLVKKIIERSQLAIKNNKNK